MSLTVTWNINPIDPRNGMSCKQANYILGLLDKREVGDADAARKIEARTLKGEVSKRLASDWIKRLKNKPYKEATSATEEWAVVDVNTFAQMGQPSTPGEELWAMHRRHIHDAEDGTGDDLIVPRGSYALHNQGPNATNDISFFSVWISDDGSRWSVRMYRSDERCRIQRSGQYAVLNRIARDPAAAASLYGHEVGKCGICSRKLTNDESRARGIGPICAEKWGW